MTYLIYVPCPCCALVKYVVHWSNMLYTGQGMLYTGQVCCTLVRFVVHWSGLLYTGQVVVHCCLLYTGQVCCTLVRFVVHCSGLLYTVEGFCTLVRFVVHWSGLLYTGQGWSTLVRLYTGQGFCTLVRFVVYWSGCSTLVMFVVHCSGLLYTVQVCCTLVRFVVHSFSSFCPRFGLSVLRCEEHLFADPLIVQNNIHCLGLCSYSYVSVQPIHPTSATNVQVRVTQYCMALIPLTPQSYYQHLSVPTTHFCFSKFQVFWGFSFLNVPIYMYAVLICICLWTKTWSFQMLKIFSTESNIFYNCAVWTNISEVEYRAVEGAARTDRIMLCWWRCSLFSRYCSANVILSVKCEM